jgi:hypothetical protein
MMSRAAYLWGSAVSVTMLVAVASPLWHGEDDYPLSTYPMFSKARPAEIDIEHLVGVSADGRERKLPPSLVMRGEVLEAKVAISSAIARQEAAALCAAVAQRAPGFDPTLVRVEVRSDRYRVRSYFAGDRSPLASQVHARCRVGARR